VDGTEMAGLGRALPAGSRVGAWAPRFGRPLAGVGAIVLLVGKVPRSSSLDSPSPEPFYAGFLVAAFGFGSILSGS
jgi:hypothetical protein